MKRTLTLLAVALVALPALAGQPTPTPVARQQQKAQKQQQQRVLQQQGKEVQPTATPAMQPAAGALTFGRENPVSREPVVATPSPAALRGKPTKEQRQEQPQPTQAPVGSSNLNSSRSNFRAVQPTATPTATSRKANSGHAVEK